MHHGTAIWMCTVDLLAVAAQTPVVPLTAVMARMLTGGLMQLL
jgi:hypothetical protein